MTHPMQFQDRWKLEYFLTEIQKMLNLLRNCCRVFNVRRHHQSKYTNNYDRLSSSNQVEKVKQLEAVLASQEHTSP